MTVETKKKNWFSRHKILTALICLFVLIGILAVSTDENSEEQTNNNSGVTANSTENQSPAESDQTTECTGKVFEKTCINLKLSTCTKLCAGEDIDIPAVKTDCHSTCYQVYYYGGEKDLDDLIKEYQG